MQNNAKTREKRLKHVQNLHSQKQSRLLLIQQQVQLASLLRTKAVNFRGSQPDAATASPPTASSSPQLPAVVINLQLFQNPN